MYYLDDDMSLQEAVEKPVYRVFGGESELEGGFVTDALPQNPIQARNDLALSQHDFIGDDGNPIRNTASQVASCTVYTDDEGHIINLATGDVTDEVLNFTEVQPTSDLPGGGMEYQLQGNFDDLVQVDSVDDLRHTPTQGWLEYLDVEDRVLNGGEEDDDTDGWDITTEPADIDAILDEEEYNIQAEDVQDSWENYIGEYAEDGMDIETDAINSLIDEEEYNIQAEDVQESWEEYVENCGDDGITPEPADIDAILDEEEYSIQAEDVQESWESEEDDSWENSGSDTWESEEDDSWEDSGSDTWESEEGDSWDDSGSDTWESEEDDSWDDSDSDSWESEEDDSWDDSDSDSWESDGDDC